jgi:hypothetical protein
VGGLKCLRWQLYKQAKSIEQDKDVKGHDYICWINDKWSEWCKINGIPRYAPKSSQQHLDFDKWLQRNAQ